MSPSPPVQCLFCNHLNPGGASFCNDCGSQLQLQQCDLCGSINKRSARICYKCGAAFALAALPGGHCVLPEAGDGGGVGDQAGFAQVLTTLPESAAEALHELRAGGGKPPEHDDVARGGAAIGGGQRRACASSPADEAAGVLAPVRSVVSENGRPAALSTRRRVVLTLLVVALAGLAAYWSLRAPGSDAADPGRDLAAAGAPAVAAAAAASARPLSTAPRAEDPSVKAGGANGAAFRAFGFGGGGAPGAPAAAAELPARPAPGDAAATVERAPGKDCQPAVAALGLCNSMVK